MDDDNYYEHPGFGDFHRLFVCKRDGLAVADTGMHDKWHERFENVASNAAWGGWNRPLGRRDG